MQYYYNLYQYIFLILLTGVLVLTLLLIVSIGSLLTRLPSQAEL